MSAIFGDIEPAKEEEVHSELTGSGEEFAPLDIDLVERREQRSLFEELF